MVTQKTTSTLKSLLGFTLVELIVVITILAVLGTIGFLSVRNYGANARDSVRITDMKSNIKALSLLQIRSTTLPLPESPIAIQYNTAGSGTQTIAYQGYLGSDISRMISMNTLSLDPKTGNKYTYTTDVTQKKAQLMTYLES